MTNEEARMELIRIAEEVSEARAMLRKYAAKLRKVAKAVEAYLAGELERDKLLELYDYSPAGDGHGCDNHYIAPPAKDDGCPDVQWLTNTIELAPENMAHALKEMAGEEAQ